MLKQFTLLCLAIALLLTSSCASIVSKSNYPVTIYSTPPSATITVTDKRGMNVYQGSTPATVNLKANSGFFAKAFYQVTFELPGYDRRLVPINYKLDGWYFGNILFGGLIGMLIVDPATGAMYKLDTPVVDEVLTQSVGGGGHQLRVYELDNIPADWQNRPVRLNE